jgi:hypothetical protein
MTLIRTFPYCARPLALQLSTSDHRHFIPEDGDNMYLRNDDIYLLYLRVYTTP